MDPSVLESAKQRIASGCDDEQLLAFLRQSGCSRVEAIRVLVELKRVPLAAAKAIVHGSAVWEDEQVSAEALHQELVDSLGKKDD